MVIGLLLSYGVPVAIAMLVGLAAAKFPPQTPMEAVKALGVMLLWATGWIGLYLMAFWGILSSGIELTQAAIHLAQTAIYWVPVAVIAYIIRAQRGRAT